MQFLNYSCFSYGDEDEDPEELKQLAKQKELEAKKLEKLKSKEDERLAKEKLDIENGIEPEEFVPPVELDPKSSDHIDFGLILSKFTNLKILSIVYEMQDTGLDWEQRFFIFTDNDCLTLANGMQNS